MIPKLKSANTFFAIFANDVKGVLKILSFKTTENTFETFANEFVQFQLFEREIYENTNIKPEGHPWLKPVRFSENVAKNNNKNEIGDIDFFRVGGEEMHQVAVGPVHAGIIEPGHFRFQCSGENVQHLEISLGYQHRGVESKILETDIDKVHYTVEAVSGDASIAHTITYSRNIESLNNTVVSQNSEYIRAIALELERCTNHIGDLGAMAGDVGYLPTMSYCGRIRGDFLNMTALLCGNRFGRGIVIPGGVKRKFNAERLKLLKEKLKTGKNDFISAASILWDTPSVLARFEDVGTVSKEIAIEIGMVGVAAKASGLKRDSRYTHSIGSYKEIPIQILSLDSGDVFARGKVRYEEVLNSINIISKFIEKLEDIERDSRDKIAVDNLASDTFVITLTEGWRGEVCHIGLTDHQGKFQFYKIIDPSFHNWLGLAMALRDEQISDFPICNKSFSLSYCGFDL